MMRRQTILKRAALRAVVVGILILFSTSGYAIAEINQQNDIKNKATELSSGPIPYNNYNPALCNPLRRSLCNFEYYVGFDLKRRRMPYEKNLGSNIMPKVIPEYGVFVGVKFNEYFGLEFGASQSKKTITKDFVDGASVFSEEVIEDKAKHQAQYNMKNFNFGLSFCSTKVFAQKVHFFLKLGISREKFHIKHTIISYGFNDSADIIELDGVSDIIEKKKYLPYLATGVYIKITPSISARTTVQWSKTSSFGTILDNINDDSTYRVKLHNSISVGLGLVLTI